MRVGVSLWVNLMVVGLALVSSSSSVQAGVFLDPMAQQWVDHPSTGGPHYAAGNVFVNHQTSGWVTALHGFSGGGNRMILYRNATGTPYVAASIAVSDWTPNPQGSNFHVETLATPVHIEKGEAFMVADQQCDQCTGGYWYLAIDGQSPVTMPISKGNFELLGAYRTEAESTSAASLFPTIPVQPTVMDFMWQDDNAAIQFYSSNTGGCDPTTAEPAIPLASGLNYCTRLPSGRSATLDCGNDQTLYVWDTPDCTGTGAAWVTPDAGNAYSDFNQPQPYDLHGVCSRFVERGDSNPARDVRVFCSYQPTTLTSPTAPSINTCKNEITLSTGVTFADGTAWSDQAVTFTVDVSNSAASSSGSTVTCQAISDTNGHAACAITVSAPSSVQGFPVTATVLTSGRSVSSRIVVAARTHSVSDVIYTGPLSVSTRGYLAASVQATPITVDGAQVTGQAEFMYGDSPGQSCTSTADLVDGQYSGRCMLTAPLAPGSFDLTSTVSYAADACDIYLGAVTSSIRVLDLDATVRALAADTDGVRRNLSAIDLQTAGAETLRATRAEAALNTSMAAESARATAAELALKENYAALEARVAAAEALLSAPAAFMFRGLSTAISVAYAAPQRPGFGAANQLLKVLKFDQSLSSTAGNTITYNSATGLLTITAPGSYRLDAFVHLYDVTAGQVGTGVVAWMTPAGQPVGPNILNTNGGGVAQGTPGDDSLISSLVIVPANTTPADPFQCSLILVSMNQKQAIVTDASTFAVTKLK